MEKLDEKLIQMFYDKKIDDVEMLGQLRWLRSKIIIKLADISNPCRNFNIAEFWAFSFVNENRAIGAKANSYMNDA